MANLLAEMLRETAVQERERLIGGREKARERKREGDTAAEQARHTAPQRTLQDAATHVVDVDFFICLIRVDAIINLKYGKDTRTQTRTRSRAHMHM